MTIRLSTTQAAALARIEKSGDMPLAAPHRDKATFRALERDGYCREVTGKLFAGVEYQGYELTEKGRSFLSGRRV